MRCKCHSSSDVSFFYFSPLTDGQRCNNLYRRYIFWPKWLLLSAKLLNKSVSAIQFPGIGIGADTHFLSFVTPLTQSITEPYVPPTRPPEAAKNLGSWGSQWKILEKWHFSSFLAKKLSIWPIYSSQGQIWPLANL